MVDVMVFYTNNMANGTHRQYTIPEFSPEASSISINCLFFASLSVSLVAALASVVALQWVADYDAVITRGGSSPEDRAKRRQFRYAGVLQWKMGEIIAALPLLLYCSVILFLAGLFQWMWNVHPFVGAIVAGGASLAVLFYITSTMLSVVFVSAPFRTPLSRWIYRLSLVIMSTIYTFGKAIHFHAIPSLFERQHNKYISSLNREDRVVKSRIDLASNALVWLANQLSLSPDSYRRFLLLVGSLSPEYLPPLQSKEVAWDFIFDLLGWRYLSINQAAEITAEDRHGMVVLQQCWAMPEVRSLITPIAQMNYITDTDDPLWSQHCGAWKADYGGPNRLFLLLCDIPNCSKSSVKELDSIIRLARWRNSEPKSAQVWEATSHSSPSFTTSFFNSYIKAFTSFANHSAHFTTNREELDELIHRISDIARIATSRGGIDQDNTNALIKGYEALLDTGLAKNQNPTVPGISSPLAYGSQLRHRPPHEHALHDNFILLLARHLSPSELLTMFWLRPSNPSLSSLRDLGYKHGIYRPSSELRSLIAMHTIEQVDGLLHIFEVLQRLADVQADDPNTVGPLWRAVLPNGRNDPQFGEALGTFDTLIRRGCTVEQHCVLISLVCQDLELELVPEFEGYFTVERVGCLERVDDPCLRFLVAWVCGEDANIQERQASLWPLFSGREHLCEEASSDPNVLVSTTNYPVQTD